MSWRSKASSTGANTEPLGKSRGKPHQHRRHDDDDDDDDSAEFAEAQARFKPPPPPPPASARPRPTAAASASSFTAPPRGNGGGAGFWRPGHAGPEQAIEHERIEGGAADMDVAVDNRFGSMPLEQQRARLPIYKHRMELLYLLEKFDTVVVVGETGSGKTTQIPQYLHEAGWTAEGRVVACLQPRRVAAISVAQRVAEERGCTLGREVGYSIRFDSCASPTLTRMLFMTEGMLVREMMRDPLLSRFSVIMLDEAHERTLYMDIVIGLLFKIQKRRPGDLKLIISSATLDAESFKTFFNQGSSSKNIATILQVEGRTYPVDVYYSEKPVPDYVAATIDLLVDLHTSSPPGDILAFMTGQDEVEKVVEQVQQRLHASAGHVMASLVLPMYGGLIHAEQMKVFDRAPPDTRKIIVATNIAEASVTIEGIVYVVDCGFVKIKGYNPASGIECLVVGPVSRASANQRAGRAGRMRAGACYRLYTEAAFAETLPAASIPEMQRSDLAGVLVQLKALGIDNVLRFPFLSPPSAQAMIRGLELLYALNALDDNCKLALPLGLQIAEFPLDPKQAKMLLVSHEFGCSEEIVIIAAMLQVQNVFLQPSQKKKASQRARCKFACTEGDHLTLLNAYLAFKRPRRKSAAVWCQHHFLNYKALCRASEIRVQLLQYLRRFNVPLVSCHGDVDSVRRCVVAGYFANAAKLCGDGMYRTVRGGHPLALHPSSVLYTESAPRYVIFNEVQLTTQNYMHDVLAIEPQWLAELAPHFYEYKPHFDNSVVSHESNTEPLAKRLRMGAAWETVLS